MSAAQDIATPHHDVASIGEDVARLRASFDAGKTRPEAWRRAQLQAIKAMLEDNSQAFTDALAADFGKPTLEALAADIGATSQDVGLALKNLKKWMKPQKASSPIMVQPARSKILSEPLGVVLIISPWNYPVQLLLSPLVGAVAAGNCAVLKPSELTPHTSALLAELVPRSLDPECITLIEGGVEETTEVLNQRFDHIMYTGNGQVAKIVMAAAARHLTPVTLELGGKSPVIVDEKANLEVSARRIAWGKFMNAGQTCIAPDYVLAHSSIKDELVEKIKQVARDFYGDDPKQSKDLARIVNVRHHRRLTQLLKDAGSVAMGGETDEESRYIAPTLLTDVDPESAIMTEEIFGPILPVLSVDSIDEAIAFVNSREKPLALYVFTEDPAVGDEVLSRTSSGGACVNAAILHIVNPNLPFGGVGPSGMGAYHGKASFDTFSHKKSVLVKSTRLDMKAMYPPYTKFKTNMAKKMV